MDAHKQRATRRIRTKPSPERRRLEALALERKPQLEAARWQRRVVARGVVRRRGVEADGARRRERLRKRVGHNKLLRRGLFGGL